MDIECIRNRIDKSAGLTSALGMEFLSTPEPDVCVGRMPVDERTCQPFGFLNGGATLALAESLAGVGSLALCPEKICAGVNVCGNHLKAVPVGGIVTAIARLQHKGHALHQWLVSVTDESGDAVSTIQVTNYIKNPCAR